LITSVGYYTERLARIDRLDMTSKASGRRVALFLLAWAALFLFTDWWLLGTRFDHYLASGPSLAAAAALAVNLLLFCWLVLVVAVVVGRTRTAFLLVAAAYVLLALASRLKLANLGEPLLPWDYLSIRQFAGMASGYAHWRSFRAIRRFRAGERSLPRSRSASRFTCFTASSNPGGSRWAC
jgi:hypothetical protein